MRLKVSINNRENFTAEETAKHEASSALLETILNSIEFKYGLLSATLENTNGKNNKEIYDAIMSGSDNLNPAHDSDVDVSVMLYYKNNRVVGYTYPSTHKTWLNRKFFSQYEYNEVACNMFHEYLHKMGFGHDSASHKKSVPYALGYLVQDLGEKILKGHVLTPIAKVEYVDNSAEKPIVVTPMAKAKKMVCSRSWRSLWLVKTCWMVDA